MFVPAFPIYHIAAENEGRVPVYVGMGPELEFKWDHYMAAIKDDVRIVFLTNPHSPTGGLMKENNIRRVCEAAKNQLVVLDEAYIHFSKTNGAAWELVREYRNSASLPAHVLEGVRARGVARRLRYRGARDHRADDEHQANLEHGGAADRWRLRGAG